MMEVESKEGSSHFDIKNSQFDRTLRYMVIDLVLGNENKVNTFLKFILVRY